MEQKNFMSSNSQAASTKPFDYKNNGLWPVKHSSHLFVDLDVGNIGGFTFWNSSH